MKKNEVFAKTILGVLLTAFCFTASQAQQYMRSNFWYFGKNAGIDFNLDGNGIPEPISGPIDQLEGTAIMSDLQGNVLFSTDGVSVYDRNGNSMPNGRGLSGHESTSQVLIVPHLGNPDQYYIFTTDAGKFEHHYSLVDMSLNNGLGDVDRLQRNIPIARGSKTTEGISGIICNDEKGWIITHNGQNNKFLAYEINRTGLHNSPVESAIGPDFRYADHTGQIKFSHDGTKLVVPYYDYISYIYSVLLCDFDPGTGEVLDVDTIMLPDKFNPYGTEFSPDDTKIYLTQRGGGNSIIQIDLANNARLNTIAFASGNDLYAMLLGPDGKIYINRNSNSLSVINQPNEVGGATDFVLNGFPLLPGLEGNIGIPNFSQNYTVPECDATVLIYNNDDQLPNLLATASDYILAGSRYDAGSPSSLVTSVPVNNTRLQAGNYIELGSDFEAAPLTQASFSAFISTCSSVVCDDGTSKRSIVEENSEEESEVAGLHLFPNPLYGSELQLEYTLAEDKPVSIFLYNAVGQEVRRLEDGIRPGAGSHSHTFDVSGLAAGIYTCRMQAGEKVANQKLVVP